MLDNIISLIAVLVSKDDDMEQENEYGCHNPYEPNRSVVDTERYMYDLKMYGQSYADIARENGLYSYVRGF